MSNREALSRARFILQNLGLHDDLKAAAYEIRKRLTDLVLLGLLREDEFYKITSVLSSQSRSRLWEKYFIRKHNCRPVSRHEDRGDLERAGSYYEFKASGFNLNNELNVVQIRLWQDCGYIVQSISADGAVTFVLTHDEMVDEVKRCKAASAHGTKRVTAVNVRNELRLDFPVGSDHWKRWIRKYSTEEPFDQ